MELALSVCTEESKDEPLANPDVKNYRAAHLFIGAFVTFMN